MSHASNVAELMIRAYGGAARSVVDDRIVEMRRAGELAAAAFWEAVWECLPAPTSQLQALEQGPACEAAEAAAFPF